MKYKQLRISIAALLCAAMTVTLTPVNAEQVKADVVKDESVYAFLNSDGSVKEVTVSDWLHSDKGFDGYVDTSDLKDVENLKSTDKVKTVKDGIEWTSDADNIYYQGESTEQLPVSANVTYVLDGKKYKAEELAGKSGHLKMKIQLTNNEKEMQNIDGVNRPIYVPFVSVTMVIFKGADADNIKSSIGTVQTDSTNKIAAAVMLPGMKDSFGSLLDGRMSELKTYMKDEMVVEADVTDFSTPIVMIATSTDSEKVKEKIDTADLDKASSDLEKLKDATNDLIDGAKKLNDGAHELNDKIDDLKSGANKLNDGANKLNAGLGTLEGHSKELREGAEQVANGILAQVNSALKAGGVEPVTFENYATKLNEYAGITPEMINTARNKVKSEIEKTGNKISDEDLDKILYLTAATYDPSKTPEENVANTAMTLANAKDIETKVASAVEAIKQAKGNAAEVKSVKAVFGNLNTKYNAVVETIVSEKGVKPEEAELTLVYTCQNYDAKKSFKENLETTGATLKEGKVALEKYDAAVKASAEGLGNAEIKAAFMKEAEKQMPKKLQEAYTKAINEIIEKSKDNGQPKLDENSAKEALTYGILYGSGDGIEAKVESVSDKLNTAKDVKEQTEKEEFKNAIVNPLGNAKIKGFLQSQITDEAVYTEVLKTVNNLANDEGIAKLVIYRTCQKEGVNAANFKEKALGTKTELETDKKAVVNASADPKVKAVLDLVVAGKKAQGEETNVQQEYATLIQTLMQKGATKEDAAMIIWTTCNSGLEANVVASTLEASLGKTSAELEKQKEAANSGVADPKVKAVIDQMVAASKNNDAKLNEVYGKVIATIMSSNNVEEAEAKTIFTYKILTGKEDTVVASDLSIADEVKQNMEKVEYSNALAIGLKDAAIGGAFKAEAIKQLPTKLQEAYTEAVNDIKVTLKTKKPTMTEEEASKLAPVVLAYACLYPSNAEASLKENCKSAGVELEKNEAMKNKVGEASKVVATNKVEDEVVRKVLNNFNLYEVTQEKVAEKLIEEKLDPKMAPMIITYTCMNNNVEDLTSLSKITEAIENTSKELKVANKLGDSVENAKSPEGKQMITGLLTNMVKTETGNQFLVASKTLSDILKFKTGVYAYTNGVKQAYDGTNQLKDGTNTLVDGVNKLKDGTIKLKDGTQELYDGVIKYNKEGISKLTDKESDIKKAEMIANVMKATGERRTSYTNYSGISEGTDGKVRFIYKIDTIVAPDKVRDTTVDSETKDPTKVDDGLNFWQRLVRLFTGK